MVNVSSLQLKIESDIYWAVFSIFSIHFMKPLLGNREKNTKNMVKNWECNSYWSMWFFHFAVLKSQIKVKFPPRRSPLTLISSISFARYPRIVLLLWICTVCKLYTLYTLWLRGLTATENQIWYYSLMNTKFI